MECLDTTFIIDLLKNKTEAIKKASEIKEEFIVTTTTNVFEVLQGFYFESNQKKIDIVNNFLSTVGILPLDFTASAKAAEIRVDLMKKGKDINVLDSLIAGTMLTNNCNTIITRNKDHFERVKGIKVESY